MAGVEWISCISKERVKSRELIAFPGVGKVLGTVSSGGAFSRGSDFPRVSPEDSFLGNFFDATSLGKSYHNYDIQRPCTYNLLVPTHISVRRQWAVHEDEALANRLQNEESKF